MFCISEASNRFAGLCPSIILEADATVHAALARYLDTDLLEDEDGVLVVGREEHVGQGLLLCSWGLRGNTGGGGGGRSIR